MQKWVHCISLPSLFYSFVTHSTKAQSCVQSSNKTEQNQSWRWTKGKLSNSLFGEKHLLFFVLTLYLLCSVDFYWNCLDFILKSVAWLIIQSLFWSCMHFEFFINQCMNCIWCMPRVCFCFSDCSNVTALVCSNGSASETISGAFSHLPLDLCVTFEAFVHNLVHFLKG